MNECDHRISSAAKADLCGAGAVLHQLNYQANWEQFVTWVVYKPVDVEIHDDNTRICI